MGQCVYLAGGYVLIVEGMGFINIQRGHLYWDILGYIYFRTDSIIKYGESKRKITRRTTGARDSEF